METLVNQNAELIMNTPSRFKTAASFLFTFALLTTLAFGAAERRVLVYTKNQVGPKLYVHDNIAASVAAIKKLGAENNFIVDVSDDPKSFTDENLKRYKALIFDNTNNEIFENEAQKAAFQRYMRGFKAIESPKGAEQRISLGWPGSEGGGFVGIHSASGAMRHWPWFWELLGGKFLRHPKLQVFTIKVKDTTDPATAHLPPTFQWTDEFYYHTNMPSGLHVLLAGDLTTLNDPEKDKYPGKTVDNEFPLTWRHEFEGGRAWYTALGHKSEYYSDPIFTKLLLGGILWAMGNSK